MLRVKPQNWAMRPQVSMASPWAHLRRSRALRALSEAMALGRLPRLGSQAHQRLSAEGPGCQLPAGGVDVVPARGADVDRQAVGPQGILEDANALGAGPLEA